MKQNRQWSARRLGLIVLGVWIVASPGGRAQQLAQPAEKAVWKSDIGSGFERGISTLSLEAGGTYGLAVFGSRQAHYLGLGSLSYGRMLGGGRAEERWCRGNLELRVELFGGVQYSPSGDWLIGLTPHLRYNFATGTRWVPFVDAGAGFTATGIGPPDLSNTFEFNLQASVGVHWFLRHDLALTAEARYLHLSCAGLTSPNLGLNTVAGMIGLTRFF